MLKYKLDSLDGLDESVANLYEQSGDKFILKVDGVDESDNVLGLKRQVDQLMTEKKDAAKKAKEAEEAAAKATEEAARKKGDLDALETSWQTKMDRAVADKDSELDGLRGSINKMMVDNVAITLANELSVQGSASVLLPHIKQRLKADQRDGELVTAVIDEHGRPSAMTLDDLKNEFSNNPAFAPLIVGSKASGGGANGAHGNGGAVTKKFSEMSGGELVELRKNDPAKYERLRAEHYGT